MDAGSGPKGERHRKGLGAGSQRTSSQAPRPGVLRGVALCPAPFPRGSGLRESPAGFPEDLPEGEDPLLVAPSPRDGPRDAFLGAVRGTPRKAKIPVLTLFSAVVVEGLDDGSAAATTRPNRTEKLAHEIEAALRADSEDGATPSHVPQQGRRPPPPKVGREG